MDCAMIHLKAGDVLVHADHHNWITRSRRLARGDRPFALIGRQAGVSRAGKVLTRWANVQDFFALCISDGEPVPTSPGIALASFAA